MRKMIFLLAIIGSIPAKSFSQGSYRDLLSLELDSLLNIPVSVSAKYKQTAREAPSSVTVVTSEDISRFGYRTLDEALRSVRGFCTSYDRNYSSVGMRGFGRPTDYNNRILLLVNGHVLNDNVFGSAAMGTDFGIDLGAVERIEVVRGPNSTLYGTSAMLAVVNVVTKNGRAMDALNLAVENGSFGKWEGGLQAGTPLGTRSEMFFSIYGGKTHGQDLVFPEFDDPVTHGMAADLDWERRYGFYGMAIHHGWTFHGMAVSREKGVPTAAWDTRFNDPGHKTMDQRYFAELVYAKDFGPDKNWTARMSADHYYYDAVYPAEVKTQDVSNGVWASLESQFRWDLRPNLRLIAGAKYQTSPRAKYRYWSDEGTIFGGNFPFSMGSFFVQNEYHVWNNLSVFLGMSRDMYSTSQTATMPRAAVVVNPIQSTTLKFVYGEGFRIPNVYEREYDEPGLQRRNPNLRPECIKTLEGVVEQRLTERLYATVSVYQYAMKDLIEYGIDPLDPEMTQYLNVSSVRAKGAEFELDGRWRNGVVVYVNGALQHAVNEASSERLTNSPEILVRMGLSVPVFGPVGISAEWFGESARRTLFENQDTPSFLLTNLSVNARRLGGHLDASLKVRNLWNVRVRLPGGLEHRMASIEQDGRTISLRLVYSR